MSEADHVHVRDCASRSIDDLFRGPCDCYANDECADPDCALCGASWSDFAGSHDEEYE